MLSAMRRDAGQAEPCRDGALVHDALAHETVVLRRGRPRERPVTLAYCSARRSRLLVASGRPSSLKPTAPASPSSCISVSCSPREAAAHGGVEADRRPPPRPRPSALSACSTGAVSTTGSVLAMANTAT